MHWQSSWIAIALQSGNDRCDGTANPDVNRLPGALFDGKRHDLIGNDQKQHHVLLSGIEINRNWNSLRASVGL
jgi:hypothetical protein